MTRFSATDCMRLCRIIARLLEKYSGFDHVDVYHDCLQICKEEVLMRPSSTINAVNYEPRHKDNELNDSPRDKAVLPVVIKSPWHGDDW